MRARHLLIGMLGLGLFGCGKTPSGVAGGKEGGRSEARPVQVSTTKVVKRDVPIYLDGLGTVTAWKTVTVRPQIDGKLDKVLFREGQAVKRGELLAQVDPRPFLAQLHQAEGALSRDTALLKNSRLNLERYGTLRSQNLVAQQQLDDQQSLVGQYEGAVAVDQAQVETSKLNLEYSRISAPIDGITGVRLVDEGNMVHASEQAGIVMLTQIDPIAVLFTLPQDDLHRVTKHMNEETLVVDAYSREGETRLGTGKLLVLDNQINQATATIRLKAVFENPQKLLWPNQFVKIRLLLRTRKDALIVPATAVQRGPKGSFAYVITADMTAAQRPIEVDQLIGDIAILARGVEAGENVVVEGQNQLRPGSKVNARPAAGGGKS